MGSLFILTDQCDIWRQIDIPGKPGKSQMSVWHASVPCLVIPVSQSDTEMPFARETTHVVLLPRWLEGVRSEDEVRTGRQIDATGTAVPYRYIVSGIRRYPTFGLQHTEAFAKERS